MFLVEFGIVVYKLISVLCVVSDIWLCVDGNKRITSKKSYMAMNNLKIEATERSWGDFINSYTIPTYIIYSAGSIL